MNGLFNSRAVKIILTAAVAVVIAVLSSAATYFYLQRERNNTAETAIITPVVTEPSEQTAVIVNETEAPTAENDSYSAAVDYIKQQARDVVSADCTDRDKARAVVFESLKNLMLSEYAEKPTDDTFNDDAFVVKLAVYPLKENRYIETIQYTFKNVAYTVSGAQDETYYFLLYGGDKKYCGEMEYGYVGSGDFNAFESDDGSGGFIAYENGDGRFAIIMSSGSDVSSFNPNSDITERSAKIYIAGDDSFTVTYATNDLKIEKGLSFKLVDADGEMQVIIPSIDDAPKYIFNTSSLTFETPKGPWESAPVSYDLPGLMLGLSDTDGNIRTMYIRKDGDIIRSDEYPGQIIFSRQNKLYSLSPYIWNEKFNDEQSLWYNSERGTGAADIKALTCAPLGETFALDFKKDGFTDLFFGTSDIPLYVGEDYVCYIQRSYYNWGGTLNLGSDKIRFDKLDDLSKFTLDPETAYFIPQFQETTLADIIYGDKAEEYYQPDASTYGENINPIIDFRQLAIKRNLGKWSVMLPILQEYYHPGNGSDIIWVDSFAAFSNDVPSYLASNGEKAELSGLWGNWPAKDLFKFPDSGAVCTQYDYTICIGNGDDSFQESSDLKIPISSDEYIVSINFVDVNTQSEWESELDKIK